MLFKVLCSFFCAAICLIIVAVLVDVAEQGQSQVRPSLLQFKKDLKREKKNSVVGYQKNDQTWVWALTVIIDTQLLTHNY